MTNVIEFKPKTPEDFGYIVDDDDNFIGISGKNFRMLFSKDDDGFLFNDQYIPRKELIAFVLASGLCWDVQDDCEKD